MSTLTFDTLRFANQLKTAGVPAVHAEAEAKALSEVLETNLGDLVTNKDMDARLEKTESALRQEISGSVSALRQEMSNLNAKMSDLKFELIKWVIGLLVAQTTLLLALLKFFPINS